MVGLHLVFLSTSLDHFLIKQIFILTVLFNKKAGKVSDHLKIGQICPVFEWSNY
jgi:hypothetical protein